MLETNYVTKPFGVKGQRPLWGPRGNAPSGVQGAANLVEFCNQITLRLICSKQIKNDFFFHFFKQTAATSKP